MNSRASVCEKRITHTACVLFAALAASSCMQQNQAPSSPPPGAAAQTAPVSGSAATPQAESAASAAGPAEQTVETARPPGFEPATNVRSDAGLAADAPSSGASAHWAGSGREIDSESPWRALAYDGIHSRESDAVGLLQEPRMAFRSLPRSISGDYVNWVEALESGAINPRARVAGQGAMEVRDDKILFSDTKNMPQVSFPHRAHSEWLACRNCHDWLFKAQAGGNDISMSMIARGQACGLCHGKVAFPPTECFRCHSGPRPKG